MKTLTDVVRPQVLVVQVVGMLPHVADKKREAQPLARGVLRVVGVHHLCICSRRGKQMTQQSVSVRGGDGEQPAKEKLLHNSGIIGGDGYIGVPPLPKEL